MGLGGICGSLLGGYITEYAEPSAAFLVYSLFGLVVAFLGASLPADIEADESLESGSLMTRLASSL